MEIADIRRERLRQWFEKRSIPPREKSYFSQLMSGSAPFGERSARRLERDYGMDPGYLDLPLGISTADALAKIAPQDSSIHIPRFNTGGAMGEGVELRDQPGVIETLRVSHEWLAKNLRNYSAVENLAVVTGFGDSMRPLFNSGDPLIADIGVKIVEFDAIYFFRVGSEGFIKRLQRIPTEKGLIIRAKSENASYDPWDITPSMDFEVFGRILKIWRSEDF
ncbi:peptidase S24-like family protein [Burkholderia gladioli]|uniref:Peptidase S24-like family protein n=1 Tax=Burkholderia gladioli TaxID=28095 RepID=A0A095FKS9_BURGA|nr:S24 family peptidase [Burkholderia gladioli]AJX00216.1 peptidase S24-like family protein [Burkholderia gladioli]ASD80425.1 transcriptional regulator [Burkholderia gladioli pv. gladioli]AWY54336.1 transcriptional regulator [Burkholderia gladioli pv. gladioli]KGC18003.1 peptidase S24-like family protein [Burkholderia gladioli]PEH37392.1 transcriptional regulator [Burkholderia gladioli]